MTKSHICEAACHIRDNEYKDIRQSDFASLLTMSTLISDHWEKCVDIVVQ